MKNINPIFTKSWKKLYKHFLVIKDKHMKDFFLEDVNRFKKFSLSFKDLIFLDFSKNRITNKTLTYLINLAKECGLKNSILSMFNGKFINVTENKPVLHTVLRNFDKKNIFINGKNISKKVFQSLKKMKNISNFIINKKWRGYTGKYITDIVNIGIGGSDLGPLMVTESLTPYKNRLKIHFVSNLDGTHIFQILKKINLESTIFLISSKTFTTQETMTNAKTVKKLFLKNSNFLKSDLSKHFIALSANKNKVIKFGINKNNFIPFWDWVGGRYSLWSSIGFSIVLSIGYDNFSLLLKGAYDMDNHFLNSPFKKNIPVLLALISIWYNNFFKSQTEAIYTYDQYMNKFSSYLQQLYMESNGKRIDRNFNVVSWQTGSIIWGENGTNSQHSFFQLLHQGTKLIPSDFIIPIHTHNNINNHHIKLVSHFFAQTKALAFGNSLNKNLKKKVKNKKIYKECPGNQPTNSFLINKITPYTLGALIAMYEHKVFSQGVILNIFSFDQWGVELGKDIAKDILLTLKKKNISNKYDCSTNGLINFYNSKK